MSVPAREQLHMVWPAERLAAPPDARLADGYELRTLRDGEEAEYVSLLRSAGFEQFDETQLRAWMPRILPGGLYVAAAPGGRVLAATAFAAHNPSPVHPDGGELGYVAARPEHRGRGLGRAVCAAALRRFLEAGYRCIYLKTDDWRVPAIRVYFALGFVPFFQTADMPERWRLVCEQARVPFSPEKWPAPAATRPGP